MYLRLFLILPLFLLAACAAPKPEATLSPGVTIALPKPGLAEPLHREQLLTATTKGTSRNLQTILEADAAHITLAGLSPVGARLFKVDYSATGIAVEQLTILPELPPAGQVLADIMLSYWPTAAWQPVLPPGWTLRDDTPALRTLRNAQGDPVEEIFYIARQGKREPVRIRHHIFDYEIHLADVGSEGVP
ncbi:MAG: DUF3261 domain-containing protein [Puniceicoccales bacterium]|jgi:hypothetical protein|nr:DUF3261 domain-containing protein [Puniceicoccales bacterium]